MKNIKVRFYDFFIYINYLLFGYFTILVFNLKGRRQVPKSLSLIIIKIYKTNSVYVRAYLYA